MGSGIASDLVQQENTVSVTRLPAVSLTLFSDRRGAETGSDAGRVDGVMSRAGQTETSERDRCATCPVRRTLSQRRRLRRKRKALRESLAGLQHQLVEEDWEKEIKESLPSEDWDTETYNPVYDSEDELCPGVQRMTLNHVQAQSSNHAHYSPAVHHVSPIKWVQHVHCTVVDQFMDAEE